MPETNANGLPTPTALASVSGYPAPEQMLETIREASGHELDVVKVGIKNTAKEYGLTETVMLERLYCDALQVLDNDQKLSHGGNNRRPRQRN